MREEFAAVGKPLFTGVCDVGVRAEIGKFIQSVRDELGYRNPREQRGNDDRGPVENQEKEIFEDTMQTNF